MNLNYTKIKSGYNLFVLCLLTGLVLISCSTTETENRNTFDNDSIWAMLPFQKLNDVNPVMEKGNGSFNCPVQKQLVKWEEKNVLNPATVVRNGVVYMLYRAEDNQNTSRIGLAISTDGIKFFRTFVPVLFPAEDFMKAYEWQRGTEDPRIVENDMGTYIMTYTAHDGKTARLCIATSKDLMNWTKHGPVLKDKFIDQWSKSGAIVARQKENLIVAEKINGKYWMYFGDTNLFMATSDDLIEWQPVLDNEGNLKPVLKPRPGKFDSDLVESGPYALITEHGILLLYNGMNKQTGGDASLPESTYSAGQALFNLNDPTQLIDRMESFFLKPDQPQETNEQANHICFAEGMVPFNGKWFLYYGTGSSGIGVAVKEDRSEKL